MVYCHRTRTTQVAYAFLRLGIRVPGFEPWSGHFVWAHLFAFSSCMQVDTLQWAVARYKVSY
jgi:hypothetical protein